jgi:hypothetical protein
MQSIIVDERSSSPFPDRILQYRALGLDPQSPEAILEVNPLPRLAELVGLRQGDRTIDIGFGSNFKVMEGFAELGMESFGLDNQLEDLPAGAHHFVAPHMAPPGRIESGYPLRVYCGSIEEILNPKSELRNTHFDLAVFWGSWHSSGNNWAIGGEVGEFRARELLLRTQGIEHDHQDIERVYEIMAETRLKIFQDLKALTSPGGGVMIVSSRYAGHGAGYGTDQLPTEKRIYLKLLYDWVQMGATELVIMGISKELTKKQLEVKPKSRFVAWDKVTSKDIGSLYGSKPTEGGLTVLEAPDFTWLADVMTYERQLFDVVGKEDYTLFGHNLGSYETHYPEKFIEEVCRWELPLGRIDAIYARF